MVNTKTNEIPVAQKLFPDLDLRGQFVSLDALHTRTETARKIVLKSGGDYLLTVKDNQLKLHRNIEKLLPAPKADFLPPWKPTPTEYRTFQYRKGPQREPLDSDPGSLSGAALLSAGSTSRPLAAPNPGPQG